MESKLPRGFFYGDIIKAREVSGLTLTETAFPGSLRVQQHSHEQAYFCLVLQGIYKETIGKRTRLCRPSSLVFHPSGEAHSEEIEQGGKEFSIEVSASWLQRIREHSTVLDRPTAFQGGRMAMLGGKLYTEFQSFDSVSALAIESVVLEIIVEASRRVPSPTGCNSPGWLKQVKELLHAKFLEKLNVSDIARAVDIHPVYLAGEFRRYFHCTIGEYIRQLRITHACVEIRGSDISLAQIALAAGFYDQSHFSRVFKQFVGMTPTQYRKTFRLS